MMSYGICLHLISYLLHQLKCGEVKHLHQPEGESFLKKEEQVCSLASTFHHETGGRNVQENPGGATGEAQRCGV